MQLAQPFSIFLTFAPTLLQASDGGAHTAPLSQALLAAMADHADQFLGAAYDVLMSNVRKVQR